MMVILGKKVGTKTHQLQDCLFSLKDKNNHLVNGPFHGRGGFANREFKKTTTATGGTGTSLNNRFNEQNNSCARAL